MPHSGCDEAWHKRKIADESMPDFGMEHFASEGAKVFELALGIKKELQADDVDAYAMLLSTTSRAGRKSKARELLRMAKANLAKKSMRS